MFIGIKVYIFYETFYLLRIKNRKILAKYNHECHECSHSDVFILILENKTLSFEQTVNTKTTEGLWSHLTPCCHVTTWCQTTQSTTSFDTQCPFHLTWSETVVFVCLLCIKRYVISGSSCALFCYCDADGCFNCFSLCT